MNLSTYRALIYLLLLISSIQNACSQELGTKIDFFGYADNREYKAPYTIDKTFFGTTLSPKIYLKLDQQHRLVGGVHYNQDFGISSQNKSRLNPIAYYNFNSDKIDFGIGFIPRHEKLKNIPRLILSDTLLYDRPNLEGMYFKYSKNKMNQLIFIDWLSKQGSKTRERFIVGISGIYKFGKVYFANDGTLYHNALTSTENPNEHIQDNAVLTLRLGLDFSKHTTLDSLTIDAGTVLGYDRLRSEYTKKSKAFISNIHLAHKQFFIHNTLYLGDAINLPYGDSFYHRDKYNRLDLGWIPFRGKHIDGKFTASFHFREGGMDNQQAFTLRYLFDQSLWKK
ncbi:hypothetical protein [Sphingobacterium bovistauri]|uniref:Phosphate-selective porin O and P n=1 Tax=Sphingobacterium bovistauri TaxID=2781959 RepID=A0ABS7Z5E1_9SPHI|nr:hypothetical protein [Sphingobacterium bovistauri]MCA5004767.1 hypothetical protein [Sphingobacterium bovistauri]